MVCPIPRIFEGALRLFGAAPKLARKLFGAARKLFGRLAFLGKAQVLLVAFLRMRQHVPDRYEVCAVMLRGKKSRCDYVSVSLLIASCIIACRVSKLISCTGPRSSMQGELEQEEAEGSCKLRQCFVRRTFPANVYLYMGL